MSADDKPVTVDESKPEDFEGEVATDNTIPDAELLNKISKFLVLDKHGKSHTFESLYTGPNRPRRVLIIFVRHFFCGNCQHYLHTFSESITPDALLTLPITTSVTVIGCGDPGLIDMYAEASNCPYPIFTDPQRSLFKALGMTQTLELGEQPAYMRTNMITSSLRSVWQGIKQIPRGLVFKSGEMRQVGGEFLFEPLDVTTPIAEQPAPTINGEAAEEQQGEAKHVTWAHRMRTTRDHAEIPELMEVLGLDGQGKPIKDEKRWEQALQSRKGTGSSMAAQMKAAAAANGANGTVAA